MSAFPRLVLGSSLLLSPLLLLALLRGAVAFRPDSRISPLLCRSLFLTTNVFFKENPLYVRRQSEGPGVLERSPVLTQVIQCAEQHEVGELEGVE